MNKLFDIIALDAANIVKKVDLSEIFGKTILITGASGIVGNYLLASLWQLLHQNPQNTKVLALMQSKPLPHLQKFLDYAGTEIIQGDLSDYAFCQKLPHADYVIHAAGYGQPGRFLEKPVKTLQLNTSTTLALFEKLNTDGKFLFISTSEIYSGLSNAPFNETQIGTTNTDHPRACYIESKRTGEAICNAYRAQKVPAKSARLSLAYGPGTKANDQRVINEFIQKAINGKIDLRDQGEAKRTYCYISDAVEIMWNILLNGREAIYNIGGNSKISIAELAIKIGKELNAPINFPDNSNNSVKGAPDDVWLDMSKVTKEFNKTEYIDIDTGLQKTIEWQKELYKK